MLLACAFVLSGCASAPTPIEATSLLGEPLARPAIDDAALEENLRAAAKAARADPTSESAAIWHGRRLAYLGRYQDAIEVYTRALERHPESYKLRRHRGHRYITTRRFDLAIADLAEAERLSAPFDDAVEPDGAPNEMNVPRSTDTFNILYHLALAEYLSGDFEAAAATYERVRETASANDDMLVAALNWSVITLRRVGREEEAAALLADVDPYMDVIENHDYLTLLLMYRGEVSVSEVILEATEDGGVGGATLLYGVGAWFLYHDQPVRARSMFEAARGASDWAFGSIAAEAELAR